MRFTAFMLFVSATGFVVSVGPSVSAAPVPKHLMKDAENPDLAAMQGKWMLTGITLDGMQLPGEILTQVEMSVEIRGNTFTMTAAKQNMRTTATVKLDTKANPRRITFADSKATDLDGKPVNNPGAEQMGIGLYKIEGDTFVMAAKANGKDGPPEDFVGKAGSNTGVLTFTRVKK